MRGKFRLFLTFVILLSGFAASAAPPNRITNRIDASRTRAIAGSVHRLAQSQFDRGAVDPQTRMNDLVLMIKPSRAQQAGIDQLLADQQNPSSAQFHKWLTPAEFGNRFGLSSGDHSKIVAWLTGEGFTVKQSSRALNWIAFSGSAAQVSQSLHTEIHRFQVDGETHFANTTDVTVPEALADVVGGFTGLHDFRLKSFARPVSPDYNSGSSHFLAPSDFGVIYDLNPLYQAGLNGTGQSIAIVGDSDVLLTDIRAFRTRFKLPANDPITFVFGDDPGINGDQIEGNLDLEWAGAIAPNATIYYIVASDVFNAVVSAVDLNAAPVISISYGACEVDFAAPYYRSVALQANAQGITLLNSSGDAGAAGCDRQDSEPLATRGLSVGFPAVLPEVTGVGGTEFVEGTGTYWASSNAANLGSALSYIPEMAWNESGTSGLGASGGGASLLFSRPLWQWGAGIPSDTARHVPDIALSAAGHDGYEIIYESATMIKGFVRGFFGLF
jgi:subtilase family serine protease